VAVGDREVQRGVPERGLRGRVRASGEEARHDGLEASARSVVQRAAREAVLGLEGAGRACEEEVNRPGQAEVGGHVQRRKTAVV
jgi:hypothetical protein